MTFWRKLGVTSVLAMAATQVSAAGVTVPSVEFVSADGGFIRSDDWAGKPVLVVNTASRCGFAPQYDALQELHDEYADDGLIVLAVPSDDFNQELDSIDEVKAYCELNFGLTMPMTDITHVVGQGAHPLYVWFKESHDFEPQWNFNKVLILRDGTIGGTWGSIVTPDSPQIADAIAAAVSG